MPERPSRQAKAAFELAEMGLPVFPCNWRGKTAKAPLTRAGFRDATTDSERIWRWWSRFPDAAIGLPTGRRSGLWVLDIDVRPGKDGRESLRHLKCQMPRTATAETPSGGVHYYFKNPGAALRNSAGILGVGIDTRGEGGYVIAPPSEITAGKYVWCNTLEEFGASLPLPPQELINKLQASSNGKEAIQKQISAPILDGHRNDALTRLAGKLLRENVTLPTALASELLHGVNLRRCVPPLPHQEVDAILNSIARKILRERP